VAAVFVQPDSASEQALDRARWPFDRLSSHAKRACVTARRSLGGDARFLGTSLKNLHEALLEYRWLKIIHLGSGSQSSFPARNRRELDRSQNQPRNCQFAAGWHGHCTSGGAEFM